MRTNKFSTLSSYIDDCQSKGKYFLSLEEMILNVDRESSSFRLSILRLIKKKRLARVRHSYYIIIPTEYREVGSTPPSWFIDDIMKVLKRPYYVSMLTASNIHGASHHHPQEYQVMTDKQLNPISIGKNTIRFFTKKVIDKSPILKLPTETGFINVSTIEVTVLDLIAYFKNVGYFDNVVIIISELSEKIDKTRLLEASQSGYPISVIQRLGYLLDHYGLSSVTQPLSKWIKGKTHFYVPLRPDRSKVNSKFDPKWKIIINENIEEEI